MSIGTTIIPTQVTLNGGHSAREAGVRIDGRRILALLRLHPNLQNWDRVRAEVKLQLDPNQTIDRAELSTVPSNEPGQHPTVVINGSLDAGNFWLKKAIIFQFPSNGDDTVTRRVVTSRVQKSSRFGPGIHPRAKITEKSTYRVQLQENGPSASYQQGR